MALGYIYLTTNLINGKIYIGQHKADHHDDYLGSGASLLLAIKKYKRKNFDNIILQWCDTQEELDEKEIFYIKQYKSGERGIGYNIAVGGEGGSLSFFKTEDEKILAIEKMKKTRKERLVGVGERNPMYKSGERGIHPMLGKKLSEDVKSKISNSLKGHIPWNKGKKSISEDEQQIRKVLSFLKNKNIKPVKCIDGDKVYYFKMKKDAEEKFKMSFKNTLKGHGNKKNIKCEYITKEDYLRYSDPKEVIL